MAGDETWSALADLDPAEAQRSMEERFANVAKLAEAERIDRLREMIVAEYELDEPRLLAFTRCRLRAWTAMDPGEANLIAEGYNTVFQGMPGNAAMRRASVVQTVAREMTPEEIDALHRLIPSLVSQIPAMKRTTREEAPAAAEPAAKKKGSWKFWQRG
jgi:hypothetical protein